MDLDFHPPLANTQSSLPARLVHSRIWFVAALVFVLLRALPNISYPIFRDQATYSVIAQNLLHGQKLYRDLWDIKPPAIFWIYELIIKMFGSVMWSVGVVDLLWLLAISWGIFRFAERYLGTAAALIAVGVNAEWHCRGGYEHAAQADTFLVLFVFVAYLTVMRERQWPLASHFIAGLFFGASFWLKYNALVFLPLLVFVPALDLSSLDPRPLRIRLLVPWHVWFGRTSILIAGWLTTIGAVLSYFWRAGLWTTLLESHFSVLPRYGAFLPRSYSDYRFVPLVATLNYLGPLTLWVPVAGILLARRKREVGRFAPVFIGATLGYILVATQVGFLPHTFECCYPFFAMAWGYLAVKAFEGWRSLDHSLAVRGDRLDRLFVPVVVFVGIVWLLAAEGSIVVKRYHQLRDWSRNGTQFYAHYPSPYSRDYLEEQMSIIGLLREKSSPQDGLYVWGHYPLMYYLTDLRPPTRFVAYWPLAQGWGVPGWREEFMHDLKRSPPRFIVLLRKDVGRKPFPEFYAFISDFYRPTAEFPNFVVYRRAALP